MIGRKSQRFRITAGVGVAQRAACGEQCADKPMMTRRRLHLRGQVTLITDV
jgi:hypothetical protein